MVEEWKTIEGCSHYQVSNLGRIKNVEFEYTGPAGSKHKSVKKVKKERIHKVTQGKGSTYAMICIKTDEGKKITPYVHRLVAKAFIPNPNNYTDVDHIDKDLSNNTVENLRWLSHQLNLNNKGPYKHSEAYYLKHPEKRR